MIRTDREYRRALRSRDETRQRLEDSRATLEAQGLNPDAIRRILTPTMANLSQLEAETSEYERIKSGIIDSARIEDLGRYLVQARIARGWSPRQLAEALHVDEALISRDEQNEYRGITKERAQRILNVLGVGESSVSPSAPKSSGTTSTRQFMT